MIHIFEEASRKVEAIGTLTYEIAQKVSRQSLLTQLAEESAELTQAALKLVRSESSDNPTPMLPQILRDHLLEEVADVYNCLGTLSAMLDPDEIADIQLQKLMRWSVRLDEADEDPDDDPQRELFDDLMDESGNRPG